MSSAVKFDVSGEWLTRYCRQLNDDKLTKKAYDMFEAAFDNIDKEQIKFILKGDVGFTSDKYGNMLLVAESKKGESLISQWDRRGLTRLEMVDA